MSLSGKSQSDTSDSIRSGSGRTDSSKTGSSRTGSGRAKFDKLNLIEWPTVFLGFGIYATWLLLTRFHAQIPGWLLMLSGGLVIAWQSSFQHEVVHGHPTRWRRVNFAFGFAPLSLWLPFQIYQKSHRRHHKDESLTDPLDDPESKYLSLSHWQSASWIARIIEVAQSSLLGRVLIGPFWMIGKFLLSEFRNLLRSDYSNLPVWSLHLVSVAVVLFWVMFVCGISFEKYILYFVYPGTAILMLRSFAEHRSADAVAHRTAIIENASILGLVFLNNNLHAVHHRYPGVSWYALPELYRKKRDNFLADNLGLVYNGYGDIISRFLLKPHDQILHPEHSLHSDGQDAVLRGGGENDRSS